MVLFRELKGLQKAARSEGFGEENMVDLMYGRDNGSDICRDEGEFEFGGLGKNGGCFRGLMIWICSCYFVFICGLENDHIWRCFWIAF